MADKICNSCATPILNKKGSVEFTCPNCGKAKIIRCLSCRTSSATYKCPNCGFEGPA